MVESVSVLSLLAAGEEEESMGEEEGGGGREVKEQEEGADMRAVMEVRVWSRSGEEEEDFGGVCDPSKN